MRVGRAPLLSIGIAVLLAPSPLAGERIGDHEVIHVGCGGGQVTVRDEETGEVLDCFCPWGEIWDPSEAKCETPAGFAGLDEICGRIVDCSLDPGPKLPPGGSDPDPEPCTMEGEDTERISCADGVRRCSDRFAEDIRFCLSLIHI